MEAVEAGRIGSVKMTMKPEQMSKLKYEKSVQKENETRSSLSSIPRTLSARINAGYQHYHSPSICRFQSSLQSTLNISSSLFHRSIGAGDHSFCSFLASLLCGEMGKNWCLDFNAKQYVSPWYQIIYIQSLHAEKILGKFKTLATRESRSPIDCHRHPNSSTVLALCRLLIFWLLAVT